MVNPKICRLPLHLYSLHSAGRGHLSVAHRGSLAPAPRVSIEAVFMGVHRDFMGFSVVFWVI